MSTLIINGSPKGEKGNSHIFAGKFVKGMKRPCKIRSIVKENYALLAKEIKTYDTIIFVMPLYVHAMPGIVMKLLEQITPTEKEEKAMGFILQSGFAEPAQSRYAKRYFEMVCRRLRYRYLGTIIKGEAAGTYMVPEKMNKKLFAALEELGKYYEQTGRFSEKIRLNFEKNYTFTKAQARRNQLMYKTGLGNIMWNSMLKKHNAYEERLARPFAE